MSQSTCPDLETLFTWLAEGNPEAERHLADCADCAAVLEEHRQLEKDLLRLSDPLPPPDFVQAVMAKVEKHPVPVRREVWTGLGIFAAALAGVLGVVLTDAAVAGALGTGVASALFSMKGLLLAAIHSLGALWQTAAVPVTTVASAMLMFVLVGVRKLAFGPTEVRVNA